MHCFTKCSPCVSNFSRFQRFIKEKTSSGSWGNDILIRKHCFLTTLYVTTGVILSKAYCLVVHSAEPLLAPLSYKNILKDYPKPQ